MLYLLRHGQTSHNLQKRMQGSIGTSARQAWAYRCPDGEPLEAVRRRLSDWLDGVREDSRIVVTHGIAGSVLRGLYAGLPDEEMLRLPVPQDVFFELRRGAIRPMGAPA